MYIPYLCVLYMQYIQYYLLLNMQSAAIGGFGWYIYYTLGSPKRALFDAG